ncbi:MBL fold metallo-hydrolase [Helicobacter himalayensis]|uniref:MBL fold metallo-hydrolase n=1 Tax=Helicobacter himalayensis TaxID=1591088 RepID=UPI00083722FC|nr:MBL fold metallo-hydrolase [Helicobacter himalayensis]
MQILCRAFGRCETNCYILKFSQGEVIIDPGEGASAWVMRECQNILAILNTHGHFDHVWDNSALKKLYPNAPLICHELDSFLLQKDIFGLNLPLSEPDRVVSVYKDSQTILLAESSHNGAPEIYATFHHFPGHTPGCCMIEIGGSVFSGDFIFYRSIGRSDFAYSNAADMRESLLRFQGLDILSSLIAYPGHGQSTLISDEQKNSKFWLTRL